MWKTQIIHIQKINHRKLWLSAAARWLSITVLVALKVRADGSESAVYTTDDVIHNTLGCIIGYWYWVGLSKLGEKLHRDRE